MRDSKFLKRPVPVTREVQNYGFERINLIKSFISRCRYGNVITTLLIVLILLLSSGILPAQENPNFKLLKRQFTFLDTAISTGDKFLIPSSDSLVVTNINLQRNDDYKIDYRNGNIEFSKELFDKYLLDTTRIYDIYIYYNLFPYNFKDEYSNFDIVVERDTITGDTIRIATTSKDFIENLFEGTDLDKSGSIFRGINFGSNRDLTLNSGFRLQLNGKLASDIDITAALTDESTPLQPEGNTLKLQELDKVFIELRSNNITATLGDIDINFEKSEFVNFNRKIQGAKGFGDFNFTNLTLTGAVSRGKFNSNSFNGNDGVQGPYRLVGANNETGILVLSGTEKVYLDGIRLTRGEQADYVIDYALGQITFTNNRLITNYSRIIVDFEYSDRKYSRTLLAVNNNYDLLNKNLKIGFSYVNESDDEDKTIDFTLSESDKEILRNAGADKLKSTKSGVIFAGLDSLGKSLGQYVKRTDSAGYVYYEYLPGDTAAVYNITFTYVGTGNGDYSKISYLRYDYAGRNNGSYAPVVFIPVPTSYQIANINLEFTPGRNKDLFINFETAYSLYDRNKFSAIDNANNGGVAVFGTAGYRRNDFRLFGHNFKFLELSYSQRVINKTFYSLDRINAVEFNRNFDVQDSSEATEDLKEGNLIVSPSEIISVKANFANLKRGDFFNSLRSTASFEFNNLLSDTTNLPKLKYLFENVNSDFKPLNQKGNWIKHLAVLSYKLNLQRDIRNPANIVFDFEYMGESKKNSLNSVIGDSLLGESFAFDELTPRISFNNIYDFNLYAEFGYRKDDVPDAGNLVALSNSYTKKFGLGYSGINWFYTLFDIAIRDRKYSDYGLQVNNTDNQTVLVNSRTRFSPLNNAVTLDLLYNITSERTAKIEKLYVLVPVGQGNYIYLGDLNNNGIQDENEFQLVNYDGNYLKLNIPTDQYFPTVDLKTSARLYTKPSRYLYLAGESFFSALYNNLSTETIIKIDEKSKDPVTDNLYFLKFSSFLNDSNTLSGTQMIQQDINFFENNPLYSLRLRFIQQNGFNQYSSGNERLLNIQRSVKFRLGVTEDIIFQIEYLNKTDRNLAPPNSIRNRNIESDGFLSDISYKPIPAIESGLELNFTRATDSYPADATRADINQQILRFIYSFASIGRVRLELERSEIVFNQNVISFPYELTSGKVQGKSYFWRAFLDYSISKNIQANINYDGRLEGSRRVIHTGTAQVTAFF
ncbi:MAG: hypothetical protein JW917_07695 [Ignavibacteria bacterium]|nr:hypothetical protein [Ignavibacteria bacterium]